MLQMDHPQLVGKRSLKSSSGCQTSWRTFFVMRCEDPDVVHSVNLPALAGLPEANFCKQGRSLADTRRFYRIVFLPKLPQLSFTGWEIETLGVDASGATFARKFRMLSTLSHTPQYDTETPYI